MEDQEFTCEFRLRHNLAAVLRHRGMTAAELSRKTGVAKQVLSDWMAGVQPRKLEQLYAVARTLGVSMEALCFADAERLLKDARPILGGSVSDLGAGGAKSDDLRELKGRYEVYLRRISDE